MATLEDVRAIVSGMDRGSEREAWGLPSFYTGDKMFARATEADGQLAIRVATTTRDQIIASDPATFSVTEDYRPYPWLLVNLSSASEKQLAEHLSAAAASRS